jgi:phage replication-related protein YjqB (UPF0714/DUF867 family)
MFGRAFSKRSTRPLDLSTQLFTVKEVPVGYFRVLGHTPYERENLVVHPDLFKQIGKPRRSHVRLLDPLNDDVPSIFTLAHYDGNLAPSDPTVIWVGPQAFARLGRSSEDTPFQVKMDTSVVKNLTRAEAVTQGEYIEESFDDGVQNTFAILSPHGGDIEVKTDLMSKALYDNLQGQSKDVSVWWAEGYATVADPVNAFSKWHLTAVDVYAPDFPKLNAVVSRQFTHTMSFHGLSAGSVLLLGGNAPYKAALKTALETDIPGLTVTLTEIEELDGDSPRNLINRYNVTGTNSIQLEIGFTARQNFETEIVTSIANYMAANHL